MCIWLSEHLSTYHLSLACAGSKGEAVRAHSREMRTGMTGFLPSAGLTREEKNIYSYGQF